MRGRGRARRVILPAVPVETTPASLPGPSVWPSTPEPPAAGRVQRRLERIGIGLLTLIGVLGFAVFPTYPNYDSIYALLWGREVTQLHTPSFTAYLAPTEHPLAVALGAVLSLLGHVGDRVWIAFCIASMVLLLIGLYQLGRDLFTPIVGLFAALLLASRLDFAFLAALGYTDTAFLAFVVWAAVFEVRKPKRGTLPLVLQVEVVTSVPLGVMFELSR